MSKFNWNGWHTTQLTLNIMHRCAERLGLDIHDDEVADQLYWICCDLESWPEGEGFGSSDSYGYIKSAAEEFGIVWPPEEEAA